MNDYETETEINRIVLSMTPDAIAKELVKLRAQLATIFSHVDDEDDGLWDTVMLVKQGAAPPACLHDECVTILVNKCKDCGQVVDELGVYQGEKPAAPAPLTNEPDINGRARRQMHPAPIFPSPAQQPADGRLVTNSLVSGNGKAADICANPECGHPRSLHQHTATNAGSCNAIHCECLKFKAKGGDE